ncbi:ATP-binding protein [uncultured Jannaschia sp.]|uniref:ATP-binding protein n=1 Tax=uncultured Jannaschia sp. TaxID=293347 RepID=UPI002606FCD8|nr:ATP-binding protein [uncultured Jannaschia sp.]
MGGIGRIGRHRHALGIIALTLVSVVIFAAIVTMFLNLDERQREIEAGIREDAVWAAFQADRETGRLIETILSAQSEPGDEMLDAVVLRYDILYSRARLMAEGKFANAIGGNAEVVDLARATYNAVMDFAPVIDAVAADRQALQAALPDLLARAVPIRSLTERLAKVANAANNEARVGARSEVKVRYHQIAVSVGVLTLALVLIVTLLAVQLRQISRTGRDLEEMNRRIARTAEAAEVGNRAKTRFLAAMSHEIRTPLNGLIGMTDVLSETPLTPEQRRHVDTIRHSGNLLLDVISDILDYSKLENGHTTIHAERVDLAEILEPVHIVMTPRAQAAGLDFAIEAPDVSVETDPTRIRQVLINLVGNAIKFTPRGSVRLTVRPRDGTGLRFEVRDTGVGICAEDVPRLFTEFSQVDGSHARQFGGTGLGLAICKRLVTVLGGTIGVETVHGVGSCFWFEVPVERIAVSEAAAPVASRPAARSGFDGCRVLVVEDNPINRDVACELLRQVGASVDCAVDGEDGISAITAATFDLVFMDMQMPRVDGLTATRRIRELGLTVPIVGLTANAFVSDRNDCLAAGMDDFVAKPITREKLIATLERWLPAPAACEPEASAEPAPASHPQRAALEAELGAGYVGELVSQFVDQGQDLIAEIRAAFEAGDAVRGDRALHTLKGSALTLGLDEIAEIAASCRASPEADRIARLDNLLAEMREAA